MVKQSKPMTRARAVIIEAEKMLAIGNVPAAIQLYKKWLDNFPADSNRILVEYNIASHLQEIGLIEEAKRYYKKILAENPGMFMAVINLGLILEKEAAYEELLSLWAINENLFTEEQNVEILRNRTRVFITLGSTVEALNTLELAVRIKWNTKVIMEMIKLRKQLFLWPLLIEGVPESIQYENMGPLGVYFETDDPNIVRQAALNHVRSNSREAIIKQLRKAPKRKAVGTKIKVGFLSADMREHAASRFFKHLLKGLDRTQFEIFGYDITERRREGDADRESVISLFDSYRDLHHLTDERAGRTIYADDIDILIDMSMHTEGSRANILAMKPAPVQMSYLGFLGTSMLKAMDYVVVNDYLFPDSFRPYFSEKPLYFDRNLFTLERDVQVSCSHSREDLWLPDNAFVFGALTNPNKITESHFKVWIEILKRTENAVLWIQKGDTQGVISLINHAHRMGADASRIVICPRLNAADFRGAMQYCDIFLDTFPCSNGATAIDAIYSNIPILTMPGRTTLSRVAGNLMNDLGMTEFICKGTDDYIEKAVYFSKNRDQVSLLKKKLMLNKASSSLYDIDGYVKSFGLMLKNLVAA